MKGLVLNYQLTDNDSNKHAWIAFDISTVRSYKQSSIEDEH